MRRECGDCHACCEGFLEIKELQVGRDHPCGHLTRNGCANYETRPSICKEFSCEWLRLPEIYPEAMRPDRLMKIFVLQKHGLLVVSMTSRVETMIEPPFGLCVKGNEVYIVKDIA